MVIKAAARRRRPLRCTPTVTGKHPGRAQRRRRRFPRAAAVVVVRASAVASAASSCARVDAATTRRGRDRPPRSPRMTPDRRASGRPSFERARRTRSRLRRQRRDQGGAARAPIRWTRWPPPPPTCRHAVDRSRDPRRLGRRAPRCAPTAASACAPRRLRVAPHRAGGGIARAHRPAARGRYRDYCEVDGRLGVELSTGSSWPRGAPSGPATSNQSGALWRYAQTVGPAHLGALTHATAPGPRPRLRRHLRLTGVRVASRPRSSSVATGTTQLRAAASCPGWASFIVPMTMITTCQWAVWTPLD